MKKSRLLGVVCAVLFSFITMSANAAFIGRLETSPGSGVFQAYYDDQLDITWTANANINGFDTWYNHAAWAASLDIDGVTGWRLASMDVNGDDVVVLCTSDQEACKDNEYGHLFNYGAGTVFGSGITHASPSPFNHIQAGSYWSSTDYIDTDSAWDFGLGSGDHHTGSKTFTDYAWAVHSGDVGAVPIPPALWLFGSGLLGLIGIARKKST